MNAALRCALIAVGLPSVAGFLCLESMAIDAPELKSHTEPSSIQLKKQTDPEHHRSSNTGTGRRIEDRNIYSPDEYLIGKGQGDMVKGPVVCQRVSELSARADLAKQIRILVKEHMVDRIRDRTGHHLDQDIEVTREEIVEEYLQGVKIIDHRVDETNNTCWATAVMPKSQIGPRPAADNPGPNPTIPR